MYSDLHPERRTQQLLFYQEPQPLAEAWERAWFFSGGLVLSAEDSLLALFHCREEKRSTNGMRCQWFKKPTRKLTPTKGFAHLRAARVGRAQRKALVPASASGPWACPSNGKCQFVAKGVDSLRFILAFAGSRLEIRLCYSGNQDPLPPSRYLLHTSWGELASTRKIHNSTSHDAAPLDTGYIFRSAA